MSVCLSTRNNSAVSLVMSVCLSAPTGRIFMKLIFEDFSQSVENIRVSLKPATNNGHFTFRPIYFFDRMRNVSGESCRENQNTYFMFNNPPPRKLCHLWDMRKNTVQTHRPKTTIWRTRVACWITTATNTHSAFPLQKYLHERASLLRYTYIVCLVSLNVHYNAISTHAVHCLSVYGVPNTHDVSRAGCIHTFIFCFVSL